MAKEQIQEPINATPSKRIYRSIIADYDLQTALCELIDNVIDSSMRNKLGRIAKIQITLDFDQQSILIIDDAGGIAPEHLPKLIKPGASDNDGNQGSIGIFGIGSKRAAVALAADVQIQTRWGKTHNSFQLEYDDEWLSDEDNWDLNYYKIGDISEGTTRIRLSLLRFPIKSSDEKRLAEHFGRVYAHFISQKIVSISINNDPAKPIFFNQWAFPPGCQPYSFERRMVIPGRALPFLFKVTSGLTWEQGSVQSNYGVYIYCNSRLVVAADKHAAFGFVSGIAGVPHPRMSNARIIVELSGAATDMPWTSNKTGINFNHQIMRLIGDDIQVAVKNATGLSKRLQPDFEDSVLPFKSGEVVHQKLKPEEQIKPSKLPAIPTAKRSARDTVVELNKRLAIDKPHTAGVIDGIVAAQLIKEKTKLQFKNRILLLILDSCLEIAFKDYLVFETPSSIAEARLQSFSRIDLENEVAKHVFTGNTTLWSKVQYFYKLRCDLTHKRSSATINDVQMEQFEKLVYKIFKKMFGVRVPNL